MKATYFLLAVGALWAALPASAARATERQREVEPTPAPLTLSPQGEFRNCIDYGLQLSDMDWDGADGLPSTLFGVRFAFDHVIGSLGKEHTWSLMGSLGYGSGSKGDLDVDLFSVNVGANLNFKVSPSTYIFVGPRVGVSSFSIDTPHGGGDDDNAKQFGLTAGVRFFVGESGQHSLELGLNHSLYKMDDSEVDPTATSLFLGGSFAF